MFKRNANKILIFVIIIQLIIPVAMLLYQADISRNLKKEENYFIIPLKSIEYYYDSCSLEMSIDNYTDYDKNYFVFEKTENTTNFINSDSKPKHNNYLYLDINSMYDFYNLNYTPEFSFNFDLIENTNTIYNTDNEKRNISNGLVEGPETEAYAIVSVYKGQTEVINVFIDNYTLEEYLKACESNLIDLKRYQYIDEFNFSEYFENLPDNQKDLINNVAESFLT
ncbi:MAG: hypothetical protein IKK46_04610 [Clostridia bacterium]|nr:hypothetical protein [Clostridia bacterium]